MSNPSHEATGSRRSQIPDRLPYDLGRILREYVLAERNAVAAQDALQTAIRNVRDVVGRGELEMERHYLVAGVVVYVAHFEANGPAVEIVTEKLYPVGDGEPFIASAQADAGEGGAS
jgi:hypothetical protein